MFDVFIKYIMNKIIHKYIEHHDLLYRYNILKITRNSTLYIINNRYIFMYELYHYFEFLIDIEKVKTTGHSIIHNNNYSHIIYFK